MTYKGIAISGKAGAGKSTLAAAILEELGRISLRGQKVSFADPVKQEVLDIYGLTKEDDGGREALMKHGIERRGQDPLYWVKKAEALCLRLRSSGIVPVFDDLRFENEMEWAITFPLYTVRLELPLEVLEARTPHPDRSNPTEVSLDGETRWDAIYGEHLVPETGAKAVVTSWLMSSPRPVAA